MEKRLMNIDETAEYTGLTVGTLYVWVSQRKIPYVKVGRRTMFDLREINRWIEANKVGEKNFDLSSSNVL